MLVKMGGGVGGTPDDSQNPFINGDITFSAPWQVGYEVYDGVLYAEAIIVKSGTLTATKQYLIDLWMIGGGGGDAVANSFNYNTQDGRGGGGSGHTTLALAVTLTVGTHAITIGAAGANKTVRCGQTSAGTYSGTAGGTTTIGDQSATGGSPGSVSIYGSSSSSGCNGRSGGAGGSKGGTANSNSIMTAPGENGTPGDGHIMSRFRDAAHNKDYGRTGTGASSVKGGGWGLNGSGYGSGTSGALVIRIPVE